MTWSIIARLPDSGRLGFAAASRFFALGARVPFLEAGVGVVATQALLNPHYGPKGLELLRQGRGVHETVEALVEADDGRAARQLHLMDSTGQAAAYTGEECIDWHGHRAVEDCSVAGNMLAGPAVIEHTLEAYLARDDLDFPQRLIAALRAGEEAGGDRRGRQSACLIIVHDQSYTELDLRVDDHADPIGELARLETVSRERWVHFRRYLPTRENPAGITDRARIEAEIAAATSRGTAERP